MTVTEKPNGHGNGSSGWTVGTLKELVDQRFDAMDKATVAALAAAEKAVQAALTSAKEAVAKAEEGQQKVNEGQNEFRGTLKDQAATLMPRAETELLISELRAQIADLTRSRDRWGGVSHGAGLSANVVAVMFTSILSVIGLVAAVYFATH
jgi:methylase of polypeptide subunit release factors